MKKLLATLLASSMTLTAIGGLVACGGEGSDDSKTLVVWAPQAAISSYEALVPAWKEANPDYKGYTVKFTAVDEGEVETKLNTDASKGADVFFFEAGQIKGMQEKNLLQKLGATITAEIQARDTETWVTPVMTAGEAMAFPATADNGWFLWYDSTVFDANDVKTLEGMLVKAKAQNKNIMFDYANGWYLPTFWFGGAGLTMDYVGDNYETTINNTVGQEIAKAVNGILGPSSNKMANGKPCIIKQAKDMNSEIGTGFAGGTVAAGIIGTWIATDVEEKMTEGHADYKRTDGATYDDIKCAKLPTFNAGGTAYQMGSFMGGKYCGVNAQKKTGNIAVSVSLANWFTNENGQTARFNGTQAGPTNKVVAASEAVTENKALKALVEQNEAGGYLQLQQSPSFWTGWETFGNGLYNGANEGASNLSDSDVLTALATLETTIKKI